MAVPPGPSVPIGGPCRSSSGRSGFRPIPSRRSRTMLPPGAPLPRRSTGCSKRRRHWLAGPVPARRIRPGRPGLRRPQRCIRSRLRKPLWLNDLRDLASRQPTICPTLATSQHGNIREHCRRCRVSVELRPHGRAIAERAAGPTGAPALVRGLFITTRSLFRIRPGTASFERLQSSAPVVLSLPSSERGCCSGGLQRPASCGHRGCRVGSTILVLFLRGFPMRR